MSKIQNIAILGSTGSIGTQTLDIIAEYPERFRASVLTARRNATLLAEQARKFMPDCVAIADADAYAELKQLLAGEPVEVLCGDEAIEALAADANSDMVIAAMVGYSGLRPALAAIEAGKRIGLANKETLVVAGELMTARAAATGAVIVPVDSEHSAIFQCLQGEAHDSIDRLILTASGGPFRTWSRERVAAASAADALKHPNWDMGAKVTIDSASLMNKGFEMIEARWLFGVEPERIDAIVHPQSVVHSMVQFKDGSVKAQLGVTDMHLPIRYALGYPERLATPGSRLTPDMYASLTFELPDHERFPHLGYAYEAMRCGGLTPCVLNAANEVAVAELLAGKIMFGQMAEVVEDTMNYAPSEQMVTLESLAEADSEARRRAQDYINKM